MDIAGLTVTIDGDASGLIAETQRARAAAAVLQSDYTMNFGTVKNDFYKAQRGRVEHYVDTYDLSAAEEIAAWNKMLERFSYDAAAVIDIQEKLADATKRMWEEAIESQKFALEMGYIGEEEYYSWLAQYRDTNFARWSEQYRDATLELKEYSDSLYAEMLGSATEKLSTYEKEFDTWIKHSIEMGELNSDEQIAAYERFANNYNAMVSEIVLTTQLGAEDVKALWDKAYEIRRASEENVYSLTGGAYEKWESDMQGWFDMRNTYDDWEEYGDSIVEAYSRAIVRQREFYEAGEISWQEYMDNTLRYTLERYSAAENEYDEMLADYRNEINATRSELTEKENALKTSWTVRDRKTDIAELERLIAIYENAATDRGKEKYEELLKEREKLRREEELYRLEVENNAVIEQMEEEYSALEANKKRVLSSLKSSTANIEYGIDDVRDIANELGVNYSNATESTINMMYEIYDMLTQIRDAARHSSSYTDSRNISISGADENTVRAIINGTIISGLGTVIRG